MSQGLLVALAAIGIVGCSVLATGAKTPRQTEVDARCRRLHYVSAVCSDRALQVRE